MPDIFDMINETPLNEKYADMLSMGFLGVQEMDFEGDAHVPISLWDI